MLLAQISFRLVPPGDPLDAFITVLALVDNDRGLKATSHGIVYLASHSDRLFFCSFVRSATILINPLLLNLSNPTMTSGSLLYFLQSFLISSEP